ncbi:unnamed protein product [Cuscuta campestris]|uniref:Uncharacterized protein n=1 Tax=Cuscuta campestris TaxID=132261 RepID=A0A484NFM7_9ASTE|nr:unnamed protein product [Cuscuta campestris]
MQLLQRVHPVEVPARNPAGKPVVGQVEVLQGTQFPEVRQRSFEAVVHGAENPKTRQLCQGGDVQGPTQPLAVQVEPVDPAVALAHDPVPIAPCTVARRLGEVPTRQRDGIVQRLLELQKDVCVVTSRGRRCGEKANE